MPSLSFKDPEAVLKERPDFVDLLPIGVYACDAEGRLRWYNGRAAELWGREPRIGDDSERFCGSFKLFALDGTLIRRDETAMAEALRTAEPVRGREAAIERPDGTRVAALTYIQPLKDASGRLLGAINCFHDTAELHRDAEPMLAELNHRVKNNMQMLHALLRGAKRETASAEAKAALADAGQRVGAMAAAQQVLYGAKSTHSFEIGNFMSVLCRSAQLTFGRRVNIRLKTTDGMLRNDASMPLALMLNEMITLLLKHDDGEAPLGVSVSMARDGDTLRLTVAGGDAEIAPPPPEFAASGTGLMNGLAAQLGGTFRIVRDGETRCIVEIPAPPGP